MEKEKLTPLVLTLGLIIYGCTASAGQNDKIDSDRTFTVHLYSPIIGDEDRGSIYGSGYSGPYLAPGGDTEVPPDPTPSYPSINQVDDQTNALMLSSIASAAVMYAADELLIDSTMKSRQGVRQTGPFAAARIGKYDLDVAGELDTTVITGLLGYAFNVQNSEVGVFMEMGHGTYDTRTATTEPVGEAEGDGKHNYVGFGIYGNYATPIDWLHVTGYVKGGWLRNEFSVSLDGVSANFDRTSNYWGAHLGTTRTATTEPVGEAEGDGKHNYVGFGIYGNYATPIDWLHVTGYVKGGWLRNEFSVSLDGVSANFDRTSNYWGAHLGTYGEFQVTEKFKNRTFLNYFYDGRESEAHTSSSGSIEIVESFGTFNSHRALLGSVFEYAYTPTLRPYVALTYEYVFKADVKRHVTDHSVNLILSGTDLEGSTGIGSMGWTYQNEAKSFEFDLGVNGYTGKRRGISAQLQAAWKF